MKKSILTVFLFASSLAAQVQIGKNVQIGGAVNEVKLNLQQEVTLPSECGVGGVYCTVIYPTTISSTTLRASVTTSPGTSGAIVSYGPGCGGLAACAATVTWGGYSLPTGVTAGSVTAVKPFAIYSTDTAGFTSSSTAISPAGTFGNSAASNIFPFGQTNGGTGLTGAQIPSASMSWSLSTTVGGIPKSTLNIAAVGLIVEYTGTPIADNGNVRVVRPLYFNQASNELGIDPLALSYSNGLKISSLPAASAATGQAFPIIDGASGSDCTTGGGSNVVWCESNGSAWSSFGGGGGSISGQTAGYAVEAASATTATGPFPMDDAITTAATVTVHKKLAVSSTSDPSQFSMSYNTGHAPTGAAGQAVLAPDTTGFLDVNENNTGFSRVCTAANGICASGTIPAGNGIATVSGGTAWGPTLPMVPVENYGAVSYTSAAAAAAGTDSTTAIQNCLNALTQGQCVLSGYYRVTSALSITVGSKGIHGVQRSTPLGANLSGLVSTSASADIIDLAGADSSHILYGNVFDDFVTQRSSAPTGSTTKGISITYASPNITNVTSADSHRPFYLFGAVGAVLSHDYATWGFNGFAETSGNFDCYYLDGSTGVPSNSVNINFSGCNSALGATPVTTMLHTVGTAVNDLFVDNPQAASTSYGVVVDASGSTPGTHNDIHFWNPIFDSIGISGFKITGLSAAANASLEISGGTLNIVPASSSPAIDIESSTGVSVNHVGIHSYASAILLNSSNGNSVIGNTLTEFVGTGITLTNSNSNAIHGNISYGATSATIHLNLTGTSSFNSLDGNTMAGIGTYGVQLASGAIQNTGTANNNTGGATLSGASFNYLGGATANDPDYFQSIIINGGHVPPTTLYTYTPFNSLDMNAGDIGGGNIDTPGIRFALGNNVNIGFNGSNLGMPASCTTLGLRFIKNYGETGGSVIGGIDQNGNICGWTSVTAANVTDSALTSGNCVQASTGGLLTTTAGPCATGTIASGTSALGTSAIASGACATVVTTTATGTATTDVIGWGFNGDPTAVTGYVPSTSGMLTIISYPTSGNVNFKVCNNTSASITPGAITLNWRVAR